MISPKDIERELGGVKDQATFLHLLFHTLKWPIDGESVEDVSYTWSENDLRAAGLAAKVIDSRIFQIANLDNHQPWGVFVIEFKNPDVFLAERGMTGTLRQVLRGLVPSRRKDASQPSWKREHLLFICTHKYEHFRFAYFKAPREGSKTAPLAAFGWGPDIPARTACEFNLPALEWPDNPKDAAEWVSAWAEAFDVEKVTRRFYTDYAAQFEMLRAAVKGVTGEEQKMFTQALMNRLMFLRFIERKKWLRYPADAVPGDYLRLLFAAGGYRGKSFYAGRLRNLFFEALAVKGKQQHEAIGKVEFLNGGLFEPSDLDQKVEDISDSAFASLLGPDGLFYRYNFTVQESTPLDIEVAVDPEMLGKVFEELVTGRHESGSYYTPRPVVSFMCREALKGYLTDATRIDPERIAAFVDKHDVKGITIADARKIADALDTVRAVDPACGSGAYLLGLLHEIVDLYRLLYSDKLKTDARELYRIKLDIIEKSLYGVDIDPFATNIAMLRLWLSLTVDSDRSEALPNLDFKIETGDSVAGPDPQQYDRAMFLQERARQLAKIKGDYMRAHGEQKLSLRRLIHKEQREIAFELRSLCPGAIDWRVQFCEIFFSERGGFDVVLANPPYVRQELITGQKPALKKVYKDRFSGTADLYVYFYLRGLELLAKGGVLAFISSNKFLRATYGKSLRHTLNSKSRIRILIDFGDFPIFQAITYPAILVTKKCADPTPEASIRALNWDHGARLEDLADVVTNHATEIPQRNLSDGGWQIIESTAAAVLEKLRATCQPLSRLINNAFYYGIKTGKNEVFEIDEDTRRSLVDADPKSDEIIRPWLRGRDVERWVVDWAGRYLIFTRRGINIDKYPAIKRHLQQRRKEIEPRPRDVSATNWPGRKPGSYKWYEVQDPIEYWREFDKPKIIYQVIATYQQFAFTDQPFVSNDKTWIIPNPLPGLLGYLNSKVAWYFLDQVAPKLQGGAFELRSPAMAQVPVPTLSERLAELETEAIKRTKSGEKQAAGLPKIEEQIDREVVRLCGLSAREITAVDEAIEAAGNRFPRKFRESDSYRKYVAEMFGED